MNFNPVNSTGLPTLPEGHFWRIVDEFNIEIRKTIPAEQWGKWYDEPGRLDPDDYYSGRVEHNLYRYGQEHEPGFSLYTHDGSPRHESEERIDQRTRLVNRKEEVEVKSPTFFNRDRVVKKMAEREVREVYSVKQRRHRKGEGSSLLFRKRFGEWESREVDVKRSVNEPAMHYGTYSSYAISKYRDVYVKETREFFVSGDPIDETNLYARCLETLDSWEASKKRRALLGDYPPKQFGGTR